jgi:hypothetical protein
MSRVEPYRKPFRYRKITKGEQLVDLVLLVRIDFRRENTMSRRPYAEDASLTCPAGDVANGVDVDVAPGLIPLSSRALGIVVE